MGNRKIFAVLNIQEIFFDIWMNWKRLESEQAKVIPQKYYKILLTPNTTKNSGTIENMDRCFIS